MLKTSYQATVLGDFNRDGKTDLIALNPEKNTLSFYSGGGDGSFTRTKEIQVPNALSLVTGTFNGDMNLDLAVLTSSNTIEILTGNGDGTFVSTQSYPLDSSAQCLSKIDLNQDGKDDLIVSKSSLNSSEAVLFGNGNGTFNFVNGKNDAEQEGFDGTNRATTLQFVQADVTGSGEKVLIDSIYPYGSAATGQGYVLGLRRGYSAQILKDHPDTFGLNWGFYSQSNVSKSAPLSPSTMKYLAAGDFNHDGREDVALADAGGRLFMISGNDFVSTVLNNPVELDYSDASGSTVVGLLTGDFNRDGLPDLALLKQGPNRIDVLLGTSTGDFAPAVTTAISGTGVQITGGVAGDVNGDGKTDILVELDGSAGAYRMALLGAAGGSLTAGPADIR